LNETGGVAPYWKFIKNCKTEFTELHQGGLRNKEINKENHKNYTKQLSH